MDYQSDFTKKEATDSVSTNQNVSRTDTREQVLLEELASDEYGYDLRNWKETGINEEEIRKRYETGDKESDYPIISASRYFTFILPKLKTEFNTPVENVVDVIMQSRDRNWRKLKEHWADAAKQGLKIYLRDKAERNLDYPRRSYEEYVRYCNLLNEQTFPKEYFWNLAKKEYQKQKQNGLL